METFRTLVETAVAYVQGHPLTDSKQTYELEVRIGNLVSDGQFQCGYTHDEKVCIQNLIQSLEKASEQSEAIQALPASTYAIAYYKDGLRKSSLGGIVSKKTVFTADFKTDRHKDIRVVLNIETAMPSNAIPVSKAHTAMCLLQRKSFINGAYRFDVTKRTPKRMNKNDCCLSPCEYHVELELTSFEASAQGLVDRTHVLLGTHYENSSGDIIRLLPPRLVFQGVRSSKMEFKQLNHVFVCASPRKKKQRLLTI